MGLLAATRHTEAFVTQELHREERQHRVLWDVYIVMVKAEPLT